MAAALDLARRFVRASATNLIARVAPRAWIRLARQTGRGDDAQETPAGIAAYFASCFGDYFQVLGVPPQAIDTWLRGRTVLEYGPGNLPGVALLMAAHGAERVICVDRFPLVRLSRKNVAALRCLLDGLDPAARARALACLRDPDDLAGGFDPRRLDVRLDERGLSGLDSEADLVVSRAVMEHVNDIPAIFCDMERALRPGALAVHQVDLRSHGLHRRTPLDFLAWPGWMWNLMYSSKGSPNRWRIDRYREVLAGTGLVVLKLEATHRASPQDVAAVRDVLAMPFRSLSDEDLAWLGFWLICRRPERIAARASDRDATPAAMRHG
jgi:SAM-dependent methyltransferase